MGGQERRAAGCARGGVGLSLEQRGEEAPLSASRNTAAAEAASVGGPAVHAVHRGASVRGLQSTQCPEEPALARSPVC